MIGTTNFVKTLYAETYFEQQISHFFRHAVVNDHRNVSYVLFKIIESGFRNSAFKGKNAEALLIKELQPTLNVREK